MSLVSIKVEIDDVLDKVDEDVIVAFYGEYQLLEAMDEKEIVRFMVDSGYKVEDLK
jgi:hypothetical protein